MKTKTIIFKLSPEEHAVLQQQAKLENFGSMSEFIRKTIMDRAQEWRRQHEVKH